MTDIKFGVDDYNDYWKKRKERDRTGLSEIHKIVIGVVNKYAKPGAKVLDLGVGPGHTFKELQKKYDCYGVEISDEAFSLYDFPADKIKKHDLKDGVPKFTGIAPFDVVIASSILHHFPDPTELLKNIASNMNKESTFVFVTPNVSFFLHRIKYFFLGKFPEVSCGHKNFLTPYEWVKILDKEGFSISEIKTMGRHRVLLRLFPFIFSGALFFVCKLK